MKIQTFYINHHFILWNIKNQLSSKLSSFLVCMKNVRNNFHCRIVVKANMSRQNECEKCRNLF